MNREAVMAMTDEERQIKAAELMGWEFVKERIEDSFAVWIDDGWKWVKQPPGSNRLSIPDYLNDFAATWKLIDRLEAEGWMFSFDTIYGYPRQYQVDLTLEYMPLTERREDGGYVWRNDKEGNQTIDDLRDESLKRAITMAFILAMTRGNYDEG